MKKVEVELKQEKLGHYSFRVRRDHIQALKQTKIDLPESLRKFIATAVEETRAATSSNKKAPKRVTA